MKRYEMTYEYNRVGCYDDVIPVESADGDVAMSPTPTRSE